MTPSDENYCTRLREGGAMRALTDGTVKSRRSSMTPGRGVRSSRHIGARKGVVAVSGGVSIEAKQGIPMFVGVSAATCGSRGLAMQRVVIPPGGKCNPHTHLGSETALYVLQGYAETWYGEGL